MAVKLIAFDLDGTLTQHKTPLEAANRAVLERLREKYRLLMVGAGTVRRIFGQLGSFPMDIIGNYGLQEGRYDAAAGDIVLVRDVAVDCDRESVDRRMTALRRRFGYEEYAGENVEFHDSGSITLPLLGTKARQADKLAFDPDRSLRRRLLPAVREAFPEYTAFVGGSSSFDLAPRPYDKYFALCRYCQEQGISREEVVYCGDDYGPGGNDESIARSDIRFVSVDDYTRLGEYLWEFL
ncbi:HAD-IIB family hydrolase [Dysosmobacter sp.]|uniref:HAD-IIB family hydrolase n=1 Tax=Dysosmobacter sp. TaxID=2591382 RepID=UPI002A8E1ECB|nr:HAD-IIB family hydrolase [Dysosmobacter sp.]MDY3282101.1 HAD-IIB family hydrolase [Dysosmobacter sp.]